MKVNGWEKIHHANTDPKQSGVTILIQGKANFRTENITRYKEGHFITTKKVNLINHKSITIVDMYFIQLQSFKRHEAKMDRTSKLRS